MTKYVLSSHDMVAHVWASQSQTRGNVTSNRMFFDHNTIYSYGRHFALAHIMPDNTVLINCDKHSVSTSKHQSIVQRAVSHKTCIDVPDLTTLLINGAFVTGNNYREHKYKAIKRHIIANIDNMPIAATEYLFNLVGYKRNAVSFHTKAQNKRSRLLAKRQAQELAREASTKLSMLLQAINCGDLDRFINEYAPDYREQSWEKQDPEHYGYNHAQNLLAINKVLRRAKKINKLSKKRNDKTLALMRLVTARLEKWRANAWIRRQRQVKKNVVRDIQNMLRELPINCTARNMYRLRDYCATALENSYFGPKLTAKITTLRHRAGLRTKELETVEAIERVAKERLKRIDWQNGANNRFHGSTIGKGVYIRANNIERNPAGEITAGTLETSGYARVPLTHAIKAFKAIAACKSKGIAWARNGSEIRVGHFQIDKIDLNGNLTAGCHYIEWNEINLLSTELGIA